MLEERKEKESLFREVESLVGSIDLRLVELRHIGKGEKERLEVTLYKPSEPISSKDLENAYRILYPRYEVIFDNRDLTLEVMSPGVGRNIKRIDELETFTGSRASFYLKSKSAYISGTISKVERESLLLLDAEDEKGNKIDSSISIMLSDIAKAKLI